MLFRPGWSQPYIAAPFKRNDRLCASVLASPSFPGSSMADNLADKAA
jgi:hypothetical protein